MRAKKLTALALTLALAASLGLPALAAPSVSSSQATKTLTNNSATTDTQITGTIVATQLKVTLPLTISFDIDPTKANTAAGAVCNNQITQPANLTITNNSVVPIWVRVSGVSTAAVTGGRAPSLTQTASEVAGTAAANNLKMMFALKDEYSAPADFATASDWMTASTLTSNKYYLNTKKSGGTALAADYVGRLEQAGTTTVTANGTKDSVTFKLYGQINRGWQVGDSFKITPTFTVSATKPA